MAIPDDHPAPRTRDGAVFAPIRIQSSRRPRILATLASAAAVGLVAIGALDRAAILPRTATVADTPAPPAATKPAQTPRSSPPRPRGSLSPGLDHGSATDAPITFDARLEEGHVFVHGEVYSLAVSRVSVQLEDSPGHVAATRSVEVPGGSTAFRTGAVPRFEVHFMPADAARAAAGLVVSATALDSAGGRLATVSERLAGDPAGPHADL